MSGEALREIAAVFGFKFDTKDVDKAETVIGRAKAALAAFGAAVTGSALIVGVQQFVSTISDMAGDLQDASDRLGVLPGDLQALQFAFGQAGVRGEQVNAALTGLSQRMEQARAGAGPAAGAFRALGLRLHDAHGRMLPVSDMLPDIARELGRIEDPARRVQLATQLFGGAGRRLVGVLHEGAGGLEDLRGQFEALGGGLSNETIGQADDFGDSIGSLKVALISLASILAHEILPPLTRFVSWVTRTTGALRHLVDETDTVRRIGRVLVAVLISLAAVVGPILAGMLWTRLLPALRLLLPVLRQMVATGFRFLVAWGPTILAVAALALGLEDLWVLFHGGDSAIGHFLDGMFGIGASQRFVAILREAWADLGIILQRVQTWLGEVWSGITSGVASAWDTLRGFAAQVAGVFASMWNSLDEALGGALTRAWNAIMAWIRPVIDTMRRVGQAIAHPLDAAWDAVSGTLANVRQDWGELLGPGAQGRTSAAGSRGFVRTPAAAAAGATIDQRQVQVSAPIQITTSDPERAGRVAAQHILSQQQAQADAAHPRPQQE